MKASTIFKKELQEYTIKRLDSLSSGPDGTQIQNRSDKTVSLAIYDKGTKLVNKQNEDSYTISIIQIYCDAKLLKLADIVPFNGLDYTVLENQDFSDHSIYKAVANV